MLRQSTVVTRRQLSVTARTNLTHLRGVLDALYGHYRRCDRTPEFAFPAQQRLSATPDEAVRGWERLGEGTRSSASRARFTKNQRMDLSEATLRGADRGRCLLGVLLMDESLFVAQHVENLWPWCLRRALSRTAYVPCSLGHIACPRLA